MRCSSFHNRLEHRVAGVGWLSGAQLDPFKKTHWTESSGLNAETPIISLSGAFGHFLHESRPLYHYYRVQFNKDNIFEQLLKDEKI